MRIVLGCIDTRDIDVVQALPRDSVVFPADSAAEMLENALACSPDLVIINGEMPEAAQALRDLSHALPAPVLVVVQAGAICSPLPLAETDIYGYLVRPVTVDGLQQAMAIAGEQFRRLMESRTEAAKLRNAFEERKIIERAKGLLMQRRQLTEAEAYTMLREESRRERTKLVDIARAMLEEETPPEITVPKIRQQTASTAPVGRK